MQNLNGIADFLHTEIQYAFKHNLDQQKL